MLVLSRLIGETIRIGDNTQIAIADVFPPDESGGEPIVIVNVLSDEMDEDFALGVDGVITLGDEVEVMVTSVEPPARPGFSPRVKLGIRAPRHIPVFRSELLQRQQEEPWTSEN